MEYIAGNKNFNYTNSAVTLGKFDGLHLGHRQLIDKIIEYKQHGLKAVMFSFLLHPSNMLSEKEFELIYTEEEKRTILKKTGIDVLISYPFTLETKNMEPEDFIEQILLRQLDAKIIIVGNDFRFGAQRKGDVALLKQMEKVYGYQVIACDKLKIKNEIVSSSLIRNALKDGNMEKVNTMLGSPYFIRGEVIHGRKLGRTIGMPTINQLPSNNKLLPPCGVYASRTQIDSVSYAGVTNIGYKPTVGEEDNIGVETYIFDYNNDLYGRTLDVELHKFLRPEMKFGALEELVSQMSEDIAQTKSFFKHYSNA